MSRLFYFRVTTYVLEILTGTLKRSELGISTRAPLSSMVV